MNLRKIFCICSVLCGFILNLSAQEDTRWTNRIYAEGGWHYGFLMPHSDFIAFFVEEHIQGFQFNVGISTHGAKNWHQSYNYPKLGIGYFRSGLGNRHIYGNLDAVYGYVDRYYLSNHRRFNFGNRLSLGTGFVNKKFDLEHNSTNMAVGSRLNAYVNYSLELTYHILPQAGFKIGAGITHVSNGNFKQPNKGLNFFTAFSTLTWQFHSDVKPLENIAGNDASKHQFLVMSSFGNKQVSRKIGNSYVVGGISGEYARLITGNSWGGAALTLYYDPSLEKELTMNDTIKTSTSDRIRIALNLSYELKMGRISYVFQPGFYLRNPYKAPGMISNRLSVRYQLTPRLNAGLTIKAHWFAIADFFEWGIGYRWKK